MGKKNIAGKRNDAAFRDIDPSVSLAILCGETPGGKGHIASVEEHYDYAVADPCRILLRRAGWKSLEEAEEEADFFSICRLFLEEPRFYAQPRPRLQADRRANTQPYKSFPPSHGLEQKVSKPDGIESRSTELSKTINGYEDIIDQTVQTYGEFLPFFQCLLLQDLVPRLLTKQTCREMGVEEDLLRCLLEKFDDDMIAGCGIPEDILIRILSFKYQTDIREKLVYRSGKLKFENLPIVPLKEIPFVVEHMSCRDGMCQLEGSVIKPLDGAASPLLGAALSLDGAALPLEGGAARLLENETAPPYKKDPIEYYYADNRNRRYEIGWEDGEELYFLGERMRTRQRFTARFQVGPKTGGIRFMYRYKNAFQARIRMIFSDEIGLDEDKHRNTAVLGKYYVKLEKRILFAAPLHWKTKLKLFFTFSLKSIKM